jgi:uncharacterized protein (TIGR02246 family)
MSVPAAHDRTSTDDPTLGADMNENLEQLVRRLADLQAIHQLFVDYGAHLDAGDLDAYAECFTHDGQLLLGPLGRASGRDEIKAIMRPALERSAGNSFHIITSPQVDLTGDTANTVVMWTVITRGADGRPVLGMLGRHEDVVVRDTDGRWRFRRRRGFVDIPSVMPPSTSDG